MAKLGSVLASAAGPIVLLAACSGQSDAPPQPAQTLPCEVTLQQDCCTNTNGATCIGDLASAERCSNWPTSAAVHVFAECAGYTAVSVKLEANTFTQYYLYSGGALVVVMDNAEVNGQGATEIECGAGPTGFALPAACASEWLDASQGAACAAGTSTPTSICPASQ